MLKFKGIGGAVALERVTANQDQEILGIPVEYAGCHKTRYELVNWGAYTTNKELETDFLTKSQVSIVIECKKINQSTEALVTHFNIGPNKINKVEDPPLLRKITKKYFTFAGTNPRRTTKKAVTETELLQLSPEDKKFYADFGFWDSSLTKEQKVKMYTLSQECKLGKIPSCTALQPLLGN